MLFSLQNSINLSIKYKIHKISYNGKRTKAKSVAIDR